jgi:DNA-binding NtrC family response regulator
MVGLFVATERCDLRVSAGQDVVLRRSPETHQLLLSDPSVSCDPDGVAKLHLERGRLEVVPAGSTNPILLNGVKVETSAELHPGDRLRLGYTSLVVQEICDEAGESVVSVKTLSLDTSFLQRREVLGEAADRFAQWCQGFEDMASAADDDAAAEVVLRQLALLAESKRGVIAAGEPPRALTSCGLTTAEVDRILIWLGKKTSKQGVQTPTLHEVLRVDEPGRAAVGRHGDDDDPWFFFLVFSESPNPMDMAYRALSVLANMLLLHRRLHAQKSQEKLVRELRQTVQVYARPSEEQDFQIVSSEFVYRSPAMRHVCRSLARAATAPSPVLILGEPGTGKQLAAEAVHAASGRRHREMVAVSLVEIPETLIESQLFGHVARIFPGAREHHGLVARANGSTLFLDEIGEVPPTVQTKLLRVLETGVFLRIGGGRPTKVDLRVITATNRDLAKNVREGLFRQDLYDRISVIPITLPPLRDRAEDIPLLVGSFLARFNRTMGRRMEVSADGMDYLCRQPWPDNVRGLRARVERAVVLADPRATLLGERDFTTHDPSEEPAPEVGPIDAAERELMTLGRTNQSRILRELKASGGRQTKGAWGERVGMSRPVFRRELKGLVGFCMERGVSVEFFEKRLSLRPEDWRDIRKDAPEGEGEE